VDIGCFDIDIDFDVDFGNWLLDIGLVGRRDGEMSREYAPGLVLIPTTYYLLPDTYYLSLKCLHIHQLGI
jgi:hypothetical protein